jgi:hypothetical protein
LEKRTIILPGFAATTLRYAEGSRGSMAPARE